ncbi:MAG: hypothetical protein AAF666_13885 [Pseudomonadota bacterium]
MTNYEMAALAVQIVGFAGIIVSIAMVYRQIQSSVFCEYTKRYNEIELSLNPFIRDEMFDKPYDAFSDDQRAEIRAATRRYLNLCSEEFHLNQHKFIHRTTWQVWDLGIQRMLSVNAVSGAVAEIHKEFQYFKDFHDYLLKKARIVAADA